MGERFETVDAAEIAGEVAELYEPSASEANLALTLDLDGPLRLAANRELIGQGLANLLENASKYAGDAASRITLSGRATRDAVILSVADDGCGIAEGARHKARARFERLGRADQGSGLGLSLVQAIAHLHGGALTLQDNAPGLRAELRLPRKALG